MGTIRTLAFVDDTTVCSYLSEELPIGKNGEIILQDIVTGTVRWRKTVPANAGVQPFSDGKRLVLQAVRWP